MESEERGTFLWVALPFQWAYDVTYNQYEANGFTEPSASFTFPEIAQEWINQRQVVAFRALAKDNDLSQYANFPEAIMKYVSSKVPGIPLPDINQDTFSKYKQEFYEVWEIDDSHRMYLEALDEMSDEKILELSKLLNLQFYKLVKVKIIC